MNIGATLRKVTSWVLAQDQKKEKSGEAERPRRDPGGVRQHLYEQARSAATNDQFGREALDHLMESIYSSLMNEEERRALILRAWKEAAGAVAKGHLPVSLAHQNALSRYINVMGLSLEEVDYDGTYTRLLKSAVIRDVSEGVVPSLQQGRYARFDLEEDERLVWVQMNVEYHRTVTVERSEAVVHSLNMEVAPGITLGPESFPTRAVAEQQDRLVDTGLLGFSDRHLHFAGREEQLRLPYDRIHIFQRPHEDGGGFSFDLEDSGDNPQGFIIGDGEFAHALARRLERNFRDRQEERAGCESPSSTG